MDESEKEYKKTSERIAASREQMKDNGLVPIVEPEILLDGDHGIKRTLEVADKVLSGVFFYLAAYNVMFEAFFLNPAW